MNFRPLAAIIFAFVASAAFAQAPPDVQRIEVEGLRIHTADEVRLKMETHVGRPFSRETLDRDIRRLFATGWFADVRRSERSIETGPGAAVVVLEVLENDVLREIRYVGNRHFDDSEVSAGAILKTGEYFAPWKVKLDADRIRDKYLEDGYAWVKITPTESSTGRGATVTFTVREGPRVHVGSIEFHGNVGLSDSELGKAMQSKDTTIWNILSRPDFKAAQLDDDLKSLVGFARGEGYLDAKVFTRELVWTPDKKGVDIHIQIEEGIRYVVDGVEIQGARLFSVNDLYKNLRVRPGEPFALRNLDRDEQYIVDRYRERAYIDVDASPVPRYLAERGHVKLTWKITEGEKVYVGRIDFVGNHRTKEKVLRREMLLLPGEEFNKILLDVAMDRLKGLHYFEPTNPQLYGRAWGPVRDPEIVVEVLPGQEKDERDLLIHVQEGRTGNLQFGGTYSDAGGIAGKLAVTQNNFDLFDLPKSLTELFTGEAFAGAGQIARIDLQPGLRRSRYEASFTEPWVLDYPISMTLAGTYYDENFFFYRERRVGGSIDFGHRWDEFVPILPGKLDEEITHTFFGHILQGISYAAVHIPAYFFFDDHVVHGYSVAGFWKRDYAIAVGYRFARINILDIGLTAPNDVFAVAGINYLSSVTFHASVDRRNSRVFPSQGFVSNVSYEYAGYPFGGDFDFWKIGYRHQAFSTLWTRKDGGKIIFETDLRGGFAQEHYYSENLPIFERYYAGGDTLRGLEYRTVSPKERGNPIGGNIQVLASAEVTFPIIRPELFGRDVDVLRGAFFTDWGTVVAHTRDFGDFRWSVGFGVRLQIPLGPQIIPVTVDFGFPLRKQEDDRRQTVHIGFDFGF
ncbi:MAG: outer membrane protein assembly factor BamA [Planctomycetes bacterium]|nr:outer membrane protein assembly factor BamA [Planctomycetota bacterium]